MSSVSVENFKKAKYLYVVYPGATGGNHVCNMISLCAGFEPRVHKNNYKQWLVKKYKRVDYKLKHPKFVNAHVDDSIYHTDKLFSPEGSQHLRELLKERFDLDLPPEADEMHEMWFTWMQHVVKPEIVEFWKNY